MVRLIGIGLPELGVMAGLMICYWILFKLSQKVEKHIDKKRNKLHKAKGYGRND